jgi:hypothetical protein
VEVDTTILELMLTWRRGKRVTRRASLLSAPRGGDGPGLVLGQNRDYGLLTEQFLILVVAPTAEAALPVGLVFAAGNARAATRAPTTDAGAAPSLLAVFVLFVLGELE